MPLRRWVNQTAICVAAEVQRDYRNFRLERGVVTYADQIALADELLQHPEAARRIRQLDPIVILDEAQDTDPAQFSVLLEITRPPRRLDAGSRRRLIRRAPGASRWSAIFNSRSITTAPISRTTSASTTRSSPPRLAKRSPFPSPSGSINDSSIS